MCLVRANPDNGKKLPENPLKSVGENPQSCGHCSRNGSDCKQSLTIIWQVFFLTNLSETIFQMEKKIIVEAKFEVVLFL